MKNKESTRYFSDMHEKKVCKELGGKQTSNSGANLFQKGDIIVDDASLLVECKCSMNEKSSFSVKKEWIDKNKEEAYRNRLHNTCICFNFEPNGRNYYIIEDRLMFMLVNKMKEFYSN